jgi:hypothetical protein
MNEIPEPTEEGKAAELALPEGIRAELEYLDNAFTWAADEAIATEYEKIGVTQFLRTITKDEVRDFREKNRPASSIALRPLRDETGDVVAYNAYRININAANENPDAVARIDKLSTDFVAKIRTEKLKFLDAAVAQGRAEDLGEMSIEKWSTLPDDVLEEAVEIHLYNNDGKPTGKLRVYRIKN